MCSPKVINLDAAIRSACLHARAIEVEYDIDTGLASAQLDADNNVTPAAAPWR
jgi:hypothetical protein